jgi:hypothetical protein
VAKNQVLEYRVSKDWKSCFLRFITPITMS